MIYADPPWRYTQKGLQGAAEKHYPTMGIDEICALPVADLAAPDSVLFLWATFPQLPEALRLINMAWAFGRGATRRFACWRHGDTRNGRRQTSINSLLPRSRSTAESRTRKPDEARDKIVALMGDVPRVELFARQSPPGWDVWGNEVESTVPDFWTKCPEVGAKGG